MHYEYEIIRCKRRTVALEVTPDLRVVVKAPQRVSASDIEQFMDKQSHWIDERMRVMRQRMENGERLALTDEEIHRLRQSAAVDLPARVERHAAAMGVRPARVRVTSAAQRWGSCNAADGLCFSYRVMQLPDDLIDYVVAHELAHIVEKNHSSAFYAVLDEYMPDHREREARIKYGQGAV